MEGPERITFVAAIEGSSTSMTPGRGEEDVSEISASGGRKMLGRLEAEMTGVSSVLLYLLESPRPLSNVPCPESPGCSRPHLTRSRR